MALARSKPLLKVLDMIAKEDDGNRLVVTTTLGQCPTEVLVEDAKDGKLELCIINWHMPPNREEAAAELTKEEVKALIDHCQEWLTRQS